MVITEGLLLIYAWMLHLSGGRLFLLFFLRSRRSSFLGRTWVKVDKNGVMIYNDFNPYKTFYR